jgi:hypothetical protein
LPFSFDANDFPQLGNVAGNVVQAFRLLRHAFVATVYARRISEISEECDGHYPTLQCEHEKAAARPAGCRLRIDLNQRITASP